MILNKALMQEMMTEVSKDDIMADIYLISLLLSLN